jgi:hypothetical protein
MLPIGYDAAEPSLGQQPSLGAADGIQSIEAERNFIMLLCGVAVWRAQQPGRMRHIGVFITADSDPQTRRFLTAFELALQEPGLDGRPRHPS